MVSTSDGKIDNLNLNGLFQRPSMAFAFNLSRLKAKMYMIFSLQKLSNPAEKKPFCVPGRSSTRADLCCIDITCN